MVIVVVNKIGDPSSNPEKKLSKKIRSTIFLGDFEI